MFITPAPGLKGPVSFHVRHRVPMSRTLLSLKCSLRACLSSEHLAVEISESKGQYVARAARTYGGEVQLDVAPSREVSVARVLALQESIARILARVEKSADGRSTTVYYAKLELTCPENTSVIETSSSALPREVLVEVANDLRASGELKKKVDAALSSGYHIWAHELHLIASACVSEWGDFDS